MASFNSTSCSMKIRIDKGIDVEDVESERQIFKSKTYSNLKTSALADDVLAVGEAIATLVENEGVEVFKTEVSEAL